MKKNNGFGDNTSRSVYVRLENEVIDFVKRRADKESTTISNFIRNAINSALIKNADISTISRIVGIKKSDNDKVTKVYGPVSFKKARLKMKGGS